jgi:hypothetical protein
MWDSSRNLSRTIYIPHHAISARMHPRTARSAAPVESWSAASVIQDDAMQRTAWRQSVLTLEITESVAMAQLSSVVIHAIALPKAEERCHKPHTKNFRCALPFSRLTRIRGLNSALDPFPSRQPPYLGIALGYPRPLWKLQTRERVTRAIDTRGLPQERLRTLVGRFRPAPGSRRRWPPPGYLSTGHG